MKTALLVIDVQNDIVAGMGTPERQPAIDRALDEIVMRLRGLQEKARQAGIPVVMVQHDGGPGDELEEGTAGWEIRKELSLQPGDVLVEKRSCDSFHETDLQTVLEQRNISHLVVGGCQTQYCVATPVRRALPHGHGGTLIGDAHTTGDTASLQFADIVAHHNETLSGFRAGNARVRVRTAADISF